MYGAFDLKRPSTASLSKFMAYCTQLEDKIRHAMIDVIEEDVVYGAFAQALFFCMSPKFLISHSRDLDINCDVDLKRDVILLHMAVHFISYPFLSSREHYSNGHITF